MWSAREDEVQGSGRKELVPSAFCERREASVLTGGPTVTVSSASQEYVDRLEYFHFIVEETQTQEGEGLCLKSPGVLNQGFEQTSMKVNLS